MTAIRLWPPDTAAPASWWERFWEDPDQDFGPPSPGLMSLLGSVVRGRPGARVVEIAAGDGRYAIPIAALGCEVVAIELTASGVSRIQAHAAASGVTVRCEQRDFFSILDEPRRYDVVFSSGFLEEVHRSSQVAAIEGHCRWVAPGGAVVVKYCLEIAGRGQLVADGLVPAVLASAGCTIEHVEERSTMKPSHAGLLLRTGTVVARRPSTPQVLAHGRER